MEKRAFVMKLNDGYYDRYKHAHDHLWPELVKQFVDNDISSVTYYYEPYLFVLSTAPSSDVYDKLSDTETTRRWNIFMSEMLETNPDGTIKIYEVSEAFTFGIFKS